MIKTFRHKGLGEFFTTGSVRGIQAEHAKRLRLRLATLNAAEKPEDMNLPGWRLHSLSKDLKGHWAVWVSGNWRMTFTFDGEDAILVDYHDYH